MKLSILLFKIHENFKNLMKNDLSNLMKNDLSTNSLILYIIREIRAKFTLKINNK